jgi:DnaJ-class molecular chaperone
MFGMPFGQSSSMPFGQSSSMPFGQSSSMPFGQSSSMPFAHMSSMSVDDEGLEELFSGLNGFGPRIHIINRNGFSQNFQKPSPIVKTVEIEMKDVLKGANVPIEIERWIVEQGIKMFEKETIYVTIPQGIDDNEMIVLHEQGNAMNDTCKGDIKIFVKINNKSNFVRHGLNLIMEKTITLKESLCGFSFEMKYIDGKTYTIKNNRGNLIMPGYVKVIPRMGLRREGHDGCLEIHFKVEYPETLTEEQLEILSKTL